MTVRLTECGVRIGEYGCFRNVVEDLEGPAGALDGFLVPARSKQRLRQQVEIVGLRELCPVLLRTPDRALQHFYRQVVFAVAAVGRTDARQQKVGATPAYGCHEWIGGASGVVGRLRPTELDECPDVHRVDQRLPPRISLFPVDPSSPGDD